MAKNQNTKKTVAPVTSEFTNSFIEKLILNKVFTVKQYSLYFDKIFDKRWFEDDRIALNVEMLLLYSKKYSKIPDYNTLIRLIEKACEKLNKDYTEHLEILTECLNLSLEADEACIRSNIEFFVKNKGVYYTILDSIEDLEKTKDINPILAKFDKINSVNFDTDLGFDYFNELDKHIDYIINPESKLPMGIKFLDDVTNGGLLRDGRCLAVFMAQPGLGKSLMLSNIAYRVLKQDKTVLIISCEMSQDVYGKRIDSLISNDNIDKLHLTHKESFDKVRAFKNQHPDARLFIKEYPPNTIRGNDIKIYIDSLIMKGIKPDLIIIDYLNLVLPNYSTGAGSYFDVLQVAQNLRALSYLYNCPVLTATQSNGEGINNADIGLEHVSESKGTAHTGDFICALYQLGEDMEAGIINAKVLKNRLGGKHGRVHSFKLNTDTLLLEDMDCGDMIQANSPKPKSTDNIFNFPDDEMSELDVKIV